MDGRSCLYTLWAFGLAARLKTDLHLAARHKKLDYSLAARLQILLLFSKSLMVYFIVSKKALSASFFTALFLVVILLLCWGWLNDLVHGQSMGRLGDPLIVEALWCIFSFFGSRVCWMWLQGSPTILLSSGSTSIEAALIGKKVEVSLRLFDIFKHGFRFLMQELWIS